MRKFLVTTVVALGLFGCGERQSEGIDALMRAGLVQSSIPVETLALEARDFEETFEAAGVVEADEDVTVSAEISGRILKIYQEIGDKVKVGQWLAALDKSEINARIKKIDAQLARANTQLLWATKDLNRQKELFALEIAAERAFDEANRLVDTSRDDVAAAEADLELARVDLARSTIKSPIAGTVSRRHVAPGEYVRPGTELFDVVATERIKFVFSVAERDVIAIQQGDFLEVRIDAYGGKPREGLVAAISPSANPLTRTFRVEVEILNTPEAPILPGMSGRTTVVRRRFVNVLLLPEEAVLHDEEGSFVYLANDDHARRAAVEILSRYGDRAVISSDLGVEWDAIVLGQSAVTQGTSIRVRRRHQEIAEKNFD